MRTVFVTKFVPLPADSGGKQRSLASLRRIAALGDVVLCAFDDAVTDHEGLEAMGVDVRAVPLVRGARRSVRGLLSTRSVSASRFWSDELAATVRSAANEAPTDALYVNYAQLAPYGRDVDARHRVLDLHNVESSLMTSYSRSATGARRMAAGVEAGALRRIERWALEAYDDVVVVSERDRDRLPTGREVLVCPNGWEPGPVAPAAEGPVASFVALMSWAPNVDAARWLVGAVWPRVRELVPEAELRLVGRNPAPSVQALGGPGVTVTGTVPSVAPHLAASRVALAPLRAGGGSRLKILEALDAGRPVVATATGAEGLEDLIGSGIVVADEPGDMAEAIAALLRDAEAAERLGAIGNAAIADRYAWDRTLKPIVDRLAALT